MLSRVRSNLLFCQRALAGSCCAAVLGMVGLSAWAAPVASPTAGNRPPAVEVAGAWSSLGQAQKLALAPLEKAWISLSEGQKRKWIAVAKTYPGLNAADQEKLHSRMVEWAGLSPRDRELARLNFAQTKSVAKDDLAAQWKAYQALSPEDRKKLADGAKVKPVGAAVAVKPVAPSKMAAVPVTRHTPETERAAAASQNPLNRNTLLPQSAASAPAIVTDVEPLTAPSKP